MLPIVRSRALITLLVVLVSSTAEAQVALSVSEPTPNSVETGAVSVIATASSPAYPVVVTASAGTNAAQLPLVGGNIFMGSLRLTGLPEGPATVTVTAAEMPPGTGSATTQITIIHDTPPKLDVIAPTWNADFSARTAGCT